MNAYYDNASPDYGFRLSCIAPSPGGDDASGELDGGDDEQSGGSGGAIAYEYSRLNGKVQIVEWRPKGGGTWGLRFRVPAESLSGPVGNLVPNRSFALKFASDLSAMGARDSGGGDSGDHLDFVIDEAFVEGEHLVVAVTATIADSGLRQNGFVMVVVP